MHGDDLNQPDQFPHPVKEIECRETHISWVILTGDWAYKIKKPVNFGFLDFSSLEKRKYYCEEELRLNQRSAPELYESVEAVCCRDGCYNLCGQGEVVDYAVKMRQFDPEALLQNRMPSVQFDHLFFQNLGYDLARFHENAAVSGSDYEFGNADAVRFPVEENFRQISSREIDAVRVADLDKLKAWSLRQCERLGPVFERRKQQEYIRECHGDLHLANIAVIHDKAVLFDCIEFNERFRWIDVASDLAFLLMDLEFNGYTEQSNILLNAYLEYSFDYDLLPLLTFYKVYRAVVRAKVAVLSLEQADVAERPALVHQLNEYIDFAARCINVPKPLLAITCGVSGSGKSTLARAVSARLGGVRLRSDVVRKHLAGLKPLQSSNELIAGNPDVLYSRDFNTRTFRELESLAERVLAAGYPLLVDATFLKVSHRAVFAAVADKAGVPYRILYISAPLAVLKARILRRAEQGADASEAGVEIMEQQLSQFENFNLAESTVLIGFEGEVTDEAVDKLVKTLTDNRLSQ